MYCLYCSSYTRWGRLSHDRMVVGFTITYASVPITPNVQIPFMARCTKYTLRVGDLWQVSGFSGFLHQ